MILYLVHLFFSSLVVCGAVVPHQWDLTAAQVEPDGFKRSAELVNGVFPGPLLSSTKGDVIAVNVTNSLFDATMRRSTSIVRFYFYYL